MGGTQQLEVVIISDEYYVKLCHYYGEVIEDRSDGGEHPAVKFSYSDEDCHPYLDQRIILPVVFTRFHTHYLLFRSGLPSELQMHDADKSLFQFSTHVFNKSGISKRAKFPSYSISSTPIALPRHLVENWSSWGYIR